MTIDFTLKDNVTGKIKIYSEEYDPDSYLWSDGNYGCDCNRGAFFYGESYECGDTRFVLLSAVIRETGQYLGSDEGW